MTWPHRGKVQLASDNTHLADLRTLPMPRSECAIRTMRLTSTSVVAQSPPSKPDTVPGLPFAGVSAPPCPRSQLFSIYLIHISLVFPSTCPILISDSAHSPCYISKRRDLRMAVLKPQLDASRADPARPHRRPQNRIYQTNPISDLTQRIICYLYSRETNPIRPGNAVRRGVIVMPMPHIGNRRNQL
jgi:hypothetical protein